MNVEYKGIENPNVTYQITSHGALTGGQVTYLYHPGIIEAHDTFDPLLAVAIIATFLCSYPLGYFVGKMIYGKK